MLNLLSQMLNYLVTSNECNRFIGNLINVAIFRHKNAMAKTICSQVLQPHDLNCGIVKKKGCKFLLSESAQASGL